MGQRLPQDLITKVVGFIMSTRRLCRSKNYSLSFIGNMDETPLWLDMPGDTTRESIQRDTTALATATDSELDESDPFKE